jgi:hypothetical protein
MTIIPIALLMILEYSVYIIICRTEENIFVICCILRSPKNLEPKYMESHTTLSNIPTPRYA